MDRYRDELMDAIIKNNKSENDGNIDGCNNNNNNNNKRSKKNTKKKRRSKIVMKMKSKIIVE